MNTKIGLLGIVGIWFTMSMMPIAQLLPLSAYQLLLLRGAPAALVIGGYAAFRKKDGLALPDRHTLIIAMLFVLACVGLFEGIKAWGANLSAVMLDMAVLVNFAFAVHRGERITPANSGAFLLAIAGSFLAFRGWNIAELSIAGLLWSILSLVANGLFIEYAGKAKQSFFTKIFWLSLALVFVGSSSFLGDHTALTAGQVTLALIFGVATGLLNFLCAFTAFGNLKPVWTGTLVLGVTPSIVIASWLILDKTLGWDQLAGVALILSAVGYLGYSLVNKPPAKAGAVSQ